MALATTAPPAGWLLTVGTWGTDADLSQAGNTPILGNDKYVQLKNTAVATRLETDKIPFRGPAGAAVSYDLTVGYQVSDNTGANLITIGYTYYNNAGTALLTGYFHDAGNNLINGINAISTNREYASVEILLVAGDISYLKIFVLKSATAFTFDIHGAIARPRLAYDHIEADGTVAVPDNSGTWTTVPIQSSGVRTRTNAHASLPANASRAIIPGALCTVHAVIKCADIPVGSEFAIRLSATSLCSGVTTTYTGQRIVSAAASKIWEITATAIVPDEGLTYLQVEAQHSGGGAAGNITVECVRGYIAELQPWI